MSQSRALGEAEWEEVARRVLEADEYYWDYLQADRVPLEQELRSAVSEEFGRYAWAVETGAMAQAAASAAVASIAAGVNRSRRGELERGIGEAVGRVMLPRLERMRRYLELVSADRARREARLPRLAVAEVARRLDGLQDGLTLQPADYDRLCAILLPANDSGSFRRPAQDACALWGRVCREVLPEAYGEPPAPGLSAATDTIGGTDARVDVMAARESAGLGLYSPLDAELAESDVVVAPQGDNGKKDARTIGGVATEQTVMRTQGCGAWSRDDEQAPDPEWERLGRMRPPKVWHALELAADADLAALDLAMADFAWDTRLTRGESEGRHEAYLDPEQAAELATILRGRGVAARLVGPAGEVLTAVEECAGQTAPVAEAPSIAAETAPQLVAPPAQSLPLPVLPVLNAAPAAAAAAGGRPRRRKLPEQDWLPFDGDLK